jgi:5-methylcytosine-specific restriction endonuclease McrA
MAEPVSYGIRAPVLVLNRFYQPVRLTTARHAFELLYMGRAAALDESYQTHDFEQWMTLAAEPPQEFIGTARGRLRIPRLVVLSTHHRTRPASVPLTRKNVFLRDESMCQYCGVRPPSRDLSLDHVVPKSRGGRSTWENLVTACGGCNRKKGQRLTIECGMIPRRIPARPRWSSVVHQEVAPRRFEEWDAFLVAS